MFKTEGESSTKPLQKQGKKGGSEERSWIWNYYEKLVAKSPYIRTVKYQVEIYGKKGLQPYGKIMNSKDYSTSNYIAHLNTAHVEVVDFTEPNTTFDDDVEYEDSEDGDIANNQSKQQKMEELRSC
ncbi:hypothetical protein GLOIN_2v1480358 [Rhizophagus irregularis DAOM 181602=DAOM 197198]|uniref:Uncharacterized protein n=1 Tax=Rhizophagus irregularis (strain DAOM 181602 / DAOM 197198 / MUCL 43194) TaxID=747089 RepID=A0A2P4PUI8_RHIID|nr:hypothetical protein GLOIN_2v1480358 [Rhizophagus irregularis DAOM 181602=DAOM 197198]POG69034.1 hypothetical protein GLOIN_2v1480358 [Rhizophagus irregularis DAOM 181602=DAOM 197198]|eukprot:XP_025175900.1 hypothetical protein GLOIN_2v1480358 [Rhizophagus irregularis DAOM 181602=DAOM 197198]